MNGARPSLVPVARTPTRVTRVPACPGTGKPQPTSSDATKNVASAQLVDDRRSGVISTCLRVSSRPLSPLVRMTTARRPPINVVGGRHRRGEAGADAPVTAVPTYAPVVGSDVRRTAHKFAHFCGGAGPRVVVHNSYCGEYFCPRIRVGGRAPHSRVRSEVGQLQRESGRLCAVVDPDLGVQVCDMALHGALAED